MPDRPPFEKMTTQEYADWCARDEGWKTVAVTMSACGSTNDTAKARVFQWKRGDVVTFDHPFPLTLDGAAAAMPEGIRVQRHRCDTMHRWEYCLWKLHDGEYDEWYQPMEAPVWPLPDTGNEIHDRYRLAAECRWAGREAGQ